MTQLVTKVSFFVEYLPEDGQNKDQNM